MMKNYFIVICCMFIVTFLFACNTTQKSQGLDELHIFIKNNFYMIDIKESEKITEIVKKLSLIKYTDKDYELVNDDADFKIWVDDKTKNTKTVDLYFWNSEKEMIVFNLNTKKYGLIEKKIFDSIITKHANTEY